MGTTIIGALKEKGSTGGNNIMEAIRNLPTEKSSDDSSDLVVVHFSATGYNQYSIDKTYEELLEAYNNNLPVIVYSEPFLCTMPQISWDGYEDDGYHIIQLIAYIMSFEGVSNLEVTRSVLTIYPDSSIKLSMSSKKFQEYKGSPSV